MNYEEHSTGPTYCTYSTVNVRVKLHTLYTGESEKQAYTVHDKEILIMLVINFVHGYY